MAPQGLTVGHSNWAGNSSKRSRKTASLTYRSVNCRIRFRICNRSAWTFHSPARSRLRKVGAIACVIWVTWFRVIPTLSSDQSLVSWAKSAFQRSSQDGKSRKTSSRHNCDSIVRRNRYFYWRGQGVIGSGFRGKGEGEKRKRESRESGGGRGRTQNSKLKTINHQPPATNQLPRTKNQERRTKNLLKI